MQIKTIEDFRDKLYRGPDSEIEQEWAKWQAIPEPPAHDEAKLRQTAIDIVAGKVWTDRHGMGPFNTFLMLASGANGGLGSLMKAGTVYEYLENAGPRSINGQPAFLSIQFMGYDDADKLWRYVSEFEDLERQFGK